MHELSIADAVLQIALTHAQDRRIEAIEIKVGHLRQVMPDALAFAFTLVSEGTNAEGAELIMEEVPAAGVCRACGYQFRGNASDACPRCGLQNPITAPDK